MKKYIIFLVIVSAVFFMSAAYAEIRVVSVQGSVSYKAGGQWLPLRPGMTLAEGTKISTGVKSNTVIKINKHSIKVLPLTIMKISEAADDKNSSTTRLGLRRGSVWSKVERDARINRVQGVDAGSHLERARHRAD